MDHIYRSRLHWLHLCINLSFNLISIIRWLILYQWLSKKKKKILWSSLLKREHKRTELMSSLDVTVSFSSEQHFLLPTCQTVSVPMSARRSCAFTGLGEWRALASVTKQEKKKKSRCCISASVQKDKFDELLGHSRLFLLLNMHPNTAFLAPEQRSGRQHQMGRRNEMLPKYGRGARSTTWSEAFGRWTMTFFWKIRV